MPFVYHLLDDVLKFVVSNDNRLDQETLKLPAGLYTTFKTLSGGTKVMGLSSHFARLDLKKKEIEDLRMALRTAIQEMYMEGLEWKVRVYRPPNAAMAFWLMFEKFIPPSDTERQNGVRVNLSLVERENPTTKSTGFIQKSLTERASNQRQGVYESLIVVNERIREGFTSNFFYVIDGKLCTAKRNVLFGVTRSMVLRLARGYGITTNYQGLRVAELDRVSEAFICSSSRGVIPIAELVADKTYQWGRGVVTTALQELYTAQESSLSELI